MSERLSTIWMNVTTSVSWQGTSVGIVRVERSLCNELAKLYGSRFKQCVWQGERFVEWLPRAKTADGVEQIRPDREPLQPPVKPELPPIFPILPRKQALLALAQSMLSLMPGSVRPYFNRILYRIRPHVGQILVSERMKRFVTKLGFRTWVNTGLAPILKRTKWGLPALEGIFSQDDVLVSIGLDWDYPYYKKFYALRKGAGVKVVTCCYDLTPVLFPQYCVNDVAALFTSYLLEVADGSDLVLCISEQSERDLIDMLEQTGGAKPKTHVFPLGDNVPIVAIDEVSLAVQELCKTPFILFVSTIERRKNHEVLYRAYHLLCKEGKSASLPKLLFVGMQGWGVGDLMKEIELDPLTQGLIVRLNHASDAELRALYDAAEFCVFPSLYEGWGLPVGEALSLGKVVLSSDRGSLPEVGGDLVRYLDPWCPRAWAEEIERMVSVPGYREMLEDRIRSQYKERTWGQAAESVRHAIDHLVD